VSLLLNRDGGWVDVQSPSIVVGGQLHPVSRGMVFTGGKWVRFFPHEETTTLVVTSGLSGMLAVATGKTISGTVTPVTGGIPGGTVTIQSRPVGGDEWTAIGSAQVAPKAGAVTWGVTATPPECGEYEFRAVYSGTPTNLPSETEPVALTVGLSTPTGLTGGRVEDTALTFTWSAVPGATRYEVFTDGVSLGHVTSPTATVMPLKPNTSYDFTVKAKRDSVCESGISAVLRGSTSQSTVQDTGSAVIKIDPLKTNSYRPDVAWGYISSNIGQGYYTNSGSNYTGVIDYGPNADFKAKIATALGSLGSSRVNNLTVTKAEVWLFKQTGIGVGGSVKVAFHTSTAEAGVGGLPARANPLAEQDSTSGGQGKWYDVTAAYGEALIAGTARSIVLFKAATTAYSRFNGKGVSTDACVLRLTVSWDYPMSASAPGGWT
jgi:hypothetical protein